MVTITFVIIFVAMLLLIAGIDVFMYKQSLLTGFLHLFILDKGTNEGMLNVTVAFGFIASIIIDVRLKKNKGTKKS